MDIHDDKNKGHTLTPIQRKIIAGILNSRARNQQKLYRLKQPTSKDLEAINCGKTQVKTIIQSGKTKETNQSLYLVIPKHISQAKQSKIVKDVSKPKTESFSYKQPLKNELILEPVVKKTTDSVFDFTNKEVPVQDLRGVLEKSKDYIKSILPLHNDTSNPLSTDEDNDNNDNDDNNNLNNIKTTPILELNNPINLVNTAKSAISAIKNTITLNTLNSKEIKEREIVLLNFEDDTVRPVLNLSDEKISIIKKWYKLCDMLVDIESSNTVIPEFMNIELIKPYLYNIFQISETDKFINEYIPLVISNLYIQSQLGQFTQFNNTNNTINNINDNFIVSNIDLQYGEFTEVKSKYVYDNLKNQYVLQQNTNKTVNNTKFKLENYKVIIPEYLLSDKNPKESIQKNNSYFNTNNGDILPFNSEFTNFNNNDEILPYNNEYNCLNLISSFGFNCEQLNINNNTNNSVNSVNNETNNSNKTTITVIFNVDCNKTLVINSSNNMEIEILNSNPEFGFLELFTITTSNDEIIKFINNQFSNGCFLDIDILNKKLEQTAEHIKLLEQEKAKDNSLTKEKSIVTNYFKTNFIINDDINKRMKASTLYDLVINSNVLNLPKDKLSGFKNRLSEYLKEIGLQKKRYNDGFYYYGIIDKSTITSLDERIKLYEKEANALNSSYALTTPELFNYSRPESSRTENNVKIKGNLYYEPIIPCLRIDDPNLNIKIQPFI